MPEPSPAKGVDMSFKWSAFAIVLILNATAWAQPARVITIERAVGGKLAADSMHPGSSLSRPAFTINDTTCPVALEAGTVSIIRKPSLGFLPEGVLAAKKQVIAIDIRFAIFNIWGEHVLNLRHVLIKDMAFGAIEAILGGGWTATSAEAQEYYSSAAYVERVALADGTFWSADRTAISSKLATLKMKSLDPEPAADPIRPRSTL